MNKKRIIKRLYKHPGTREARLILKQHGRNLSQCERCEDDQSICHVHHKDGNPYNNHIENLIVLCKKCHAKAHGLSEDEEFTEDFLEFGVIEEDEDVPEVREIDKSVMTVELPEDMFENPSVEIPQKVSESSQATFPKPAKKPRHLCSQFLGYQCRHCRNYRPFRFWCDIHQETRNEMDKTCSHLELR